MVVLYSRRMAQSHCAKTRSFRSSTDSIAQKGSVTPFTQKISRNTKTVDLGNAFTRPENQTQLDYLAREEQRLYLETMAAMRYDAAAVGMNELLFGSVWFRGATRGLAIPYVSSNVAERGIPLAPWIWWRTTR